MSSQTIFEQCIAIEPDNCFINKKINPLEIIQFNQDNIGWNIVSREEVENLVKHSICPDVELIDYQLQYYSDEKIGFLGAHLCLIVHIKTPQFDESYKSSFFVKTIPINSPVQAAYIKEKGVFRKEVEFFRDLVPLLMKNFKGESWAPRCYLAKEDIIIFEDMKLKGFSNRSRLFNEETVRSAIACIARLHASSILAEEQMNGKRLNEFFPELMEESEFQLTGRSYTWFITAINLAISLAKSMGLDASAIHKASHRVFDICRPSQNKRNVVSHGDLWSNNMLFDDNNHCNLVDFQLVRYAPLAHDVMQLLYLTTSRKLREKCEDVIVEYYYTTLIENLSFNNYDGILPTFKEVLQGMEEQRLLAIVTAMVFHPTVLMDGKTAARIMDNPVTYEAYYFNDRKPFVDTIMAEDFEYKQKILETVKELAEMSQKFECLPQPT